MDPEAFTYDDGQWVEYGEGSQWPFWRVTGRLYDVDDEARYYRLSWQHPGTGEYREEYVPADDAVADFGAVTEETVREAGEEVLDGESGPG